MNTQFGFVRRGAALAVVAAGLAFATTAMAQTTEKTPVAAPLSAFAQSLRSELIQRLGADHPAIEAYAARGFQPIWIDANGRATSNADSLVAALARAANHALPAERYNAAGLARRLSAGGVALEADMTKSFLQFARDITSGVLEPRKIDSELHVFPQRPHAARLIAEAGIARNMPAFLRALAPQHPNYQPLLAKYAMFKSLGTSDIWGTPVAKGRTIRPGTRNSRIPALRARLIAMGDLDPSSYTLSATDGQRVAANDVTTDAGLANADDTLYDTVLVEAVKRFQGRHGLNRDGMIGPATLEQINTSPGERAQQIAVNLERLRWLNRDLGDRHILVNLAGFSMAVIENGREAFTSRVVVGKARKHRTPEFSDEMTFMVINPRWNVPSSIAVKEILPILKRDPGYLQRKSMKIVGGSAPADWSTVTPATFPGRIVQDPGRGNALGNVKFMFPNKFAIYLHDTPSKRLFRRDVRAYSHGCVRVERPVEFAEYLLTGQVEEPRAYYNRLLKRGRERQVNLDRPLPVHLTYRTSWVDADGTYQFRGDIYGRDVTVARALKQAGVSITR